ncbi:hypothetical protein ACQPZ2_28885 [Nocardia pseudovaccinii]|uniref:hypothetical protein n=1 Tax=Nocardia pseudovaccinii TaxID=189540 RepID=UPI003D929A6B
MPETQEPIADKNGGLAELLTTLDEFLRSRDLSVVQLLTDFYAARGSKNPGFHACNLVDNLCFTAHYYRQIAEHALPER